jgi:hypothetical protein
MNIACGMWVKPGYKYLSLINPYYGNLATLLFLLFLWYSDSQAMYDIPSRGGECLARVHQKNLHHTFLRRLWYGTAVAWQIETP